MTAEASIPEWLKAWLAKVPPGHCPACTRPLPLRKGRGRPAYVHSSGVNPECRKEYLRRRNEARFPSSLRAVEFRYLFEDAPVAILALNCGCFRETTASEARRVKGRARCPAHP